MGIREEEEKGEGEGGRREGVVRRKRKREISGYMAEFEKEKKRGMER